MFRHIALQLSLSVALLMPAMKPAVPDVCAGSTPDAVNASSGSAIRSGYIVASS